MKIDSIKDGIVLDHIKAGKSMDIYRYLGLDQLDCSVAIIKNVPSNKMGKKDILKMECDPDLINLDVIAFIDPRITVNVIKNGEIVEKKALSLPSEVVNVISCTNPRCITSTEHSLPQIFTLADKKRMIYRCRYCEDKYHDRGDRSWYRK